MQRTAAPAKPGIRLKADQLAKLLPDGVTSYRQIGDHLGLNASTVHRAYSGRPVGEVLIYAVRTRYPHVPYERLFTEEAPAGAAA